MSTTADAAVSCTMRGKPAPRWSVVSVAGTRALLPASMAALPARRPSVGVGPPLLRSGPTFSPPTPVAGTPVWSPACVKLVLPTAPKPGPALVEPRMLKPWSLNTPETSGLVELTCANDGGRNGAL